MTDSYTPDIRTRVKNCIVKALSLGTAPEAIADDARLFAPADEGGLELDSLAALEILVALSREFKFLPTEVKPEIFERVDTLADYIVNQVHESPTTAPEEAVSDAL